MLENIKKILSQSYPYEYDLKETLKSSAGIGLFLFLFFVFFKLFGLDRASTSTLIFFSTLNAVTSIAIAASISIGGRFLFPKKFSQESWRLVDEIGITIVILFSIGLGVTSIVIYMEGLTISLSNFAATYLEIQYNVLLVSVFPVAGLLFFNRYKQLKQQSKLVDELNRQLSQIRSRSQQSASRENDSITLLSETGKESGDQNMPILGDDPRHLGKQKTFAATPVQIGNSTPGYIYVILMGEQYDSAADMLRESFIIRNTSMGILAAFITTGLIGLILFALLTKRFHQMTSKVKEFERGKYDVRISSKSSDEVGQLSQAFDHMADTITANMEELKKTDNLRRELVANVSHDLRSPLASIQGYLETIMMKENSLSAEESRKYLQIIFDNTKMLGNLVDDLFELSKLDAQQIQPQTESFSMGDLTQDVVIKFNPLAKKLDITLDLNLAKSLPMVQADIALIERALSNLIDNAIRFTPPQGTVTIYLKKKGNQVLVDITDTGPGIPAEELPLIFERFYRIDKSRAKSYGGAGLGLAIAKKIIELHDCKIEVKSEINQGTTFSFGLETL